MTQGKCRSGALRCLFMPAFLLLSLGLAACGGSSSSSAPSMTGGNNQGGNNSGPMTGGGTAESKTFFDQILTAEDGEDIAFTVFVPENPNGKATPLVLHGHGFGLSRVKDFENPDPISGFINGTEVSAQIAKQIWLDQGFYVISFDQRGFGDSSGSITVMDPDIDCRNISQIIDWAESHLSNLGRRNDDPVIGSVGLSYGGGFQTVCGSVDRRFDALVPLATWNHLPYSLNPGGVPKNLWLDILGVASMGNLEQYLITAFLEANTTGEINQQAIDKLAGHGARSFCQGDLGRTPASADALFIQSANDVLFNINEAVDNYQCWKAAGRDTHLIIQGKGHILLPLQTPGELFLYGFDDTLYCGGQSINTVELAVDFLSSKLLGEQETINLPAVCFSRSTSQTGTDLNAVPYGGQPLLSEPASVLPGGLNSLATLLTSLPINTVLEMLTTLPVDAVETLTSVLTGLSDPASLANYADDILRLLPKEVLQQLAAPPQFIPLTTLEEDAILAGIPQLAVNISGGNGDGNVLYFGIGRQAEGGDPQLVNEQVLPVKGTGFKQIEMIGVSEDVAAEETLGLIVYGFHPYFLNIGAIAQAPLPAEVVASVGLPLLSPSQ